MKHPPDTFLSDQSLLRDYVEKGSGDAFAILVSRYQGMVYEAIKTRARDPDTARDILQDVFIVFVEKAPTLLEHPSIPAWLVRSATLEVKKRNRGDYNRHRRERRYEEANRIREARFSESQFQSVENALDDLPQVSREAVRLRYHHHKSFEEIAEILGRTPGASQRLISRAIERLRDSLDQGEDDGFRSGTAAITILSILGAMSLPSAKGAVLQPATAPPAVTPRWMPAPVRWMTGCAASGILAIGITWWSMLPGQPDSPTPVFGSASPPLSAATPPMPPNQGFTYRVTGPLSSCAQFLIQRMLDIYLGGDWHALREMQLRILSLSPYQKLNILESLDHVSSEGRPVNLLRELLLRQLAQSKACEATARSYESRIFTTAAMALRIWAVRNPENALHWYLERSRAGDIHLQRLWETYDASLVGTRWGGQGEIGFYGGLPLPADILMDASEKMAPQHLLVSSLFEGLASGDPEILKMALQRITPEDQHGAVQGVARHYLKNGRDPRLMEVIKVTYPHIMDAERVDLFARTLPSIVPDYGAHFQFFAAMLDRDHVDQKASDQILARLAKRAAPYGWDEIGNWLTRRFNDQPGHPVLHDILNAWALDDHFSIANWLRGQQGWTPADTWALDFVENAASRGSGVPLETAEIIASAISSETIRQKAIHLVNHGAFDPAIPPHHPHVHIITTRPNGSRAVTAVKLAPTGRPLDEVSMSRIRRQIKESVKQRLRNPDCSKLESGPNPTATAQLNWLDGTSQKLLRALSGLCKETIHPNSHPRSGPASPATIPELFDLLDHRLHFLSNQGFAKLLEKPGSSSSLQSWRRPLYQTLIEPAAIRAWVAKDVDAALEWAANPSPDPAARVHMLRLHVIHAAATADFPAALRIARELPPRIGHSADPLTFLAGARISLASHRELVEVALSLTPDHRDAILAASGRAILMRHGFAAARHFHETLPHPATAIHAMRLAIATRALECDAPAKAAWLLESATESSHPADLHMLVTRWLAADCPAFLDWVEELQPGPLKNQALHHAAIDIATVEPKIARQWAELIDDPQMLQETLRKLDSQHPNR